MIKKNKSTQPLLEKPYPFGLKTVMELFDVGPAIAVSALATTIAILVITIIYFIHSAPPDVITISSGPEGTTFYKNAVKYAKILEGNGVKLNVVTSQGSLENLQRLNDPSSHVDVGIAQAGITGASTDGLVSLGSISYQPLLVFYRGAPLELLSGLAGKKIAIGHEGSGARSFALALLAANGIKEGGSTQLLDWEAAEASKALLDKKIDAAFVMSENASTEILHALMHSDEVHLYNFKQANGYSRKIDFLNVLDLPEGSIDFGLDIPSHDVSLLGPMVEVVVNKSLNPALSDLLLEAMVQVHGKAGIFQKRGEFPAPIEHSIRISEDANRFFKSGKSFLYRYLPFWVASLLSRVFVVFVPMLVILIPALKSIPAFFRWRIRARIRRRYRELLSVEQEFVTESGTENLDQLRRRFDSIEDAVNKMKVPASFADQFYGLRGHIDYVRELLEKKHA